MDILKAKKQLTNLLMEASLKVGEKSIDEPSLVWWEECKLPLDLREKK
ncbi:MULTISPECIES: hypothetical protein [Clostridium]|uniref:Uncharacterized protein n=1 Tax=Clostridium cibarium TaxID=2762247 RepID=A0ABR8PYF5_9CLOT|nr:MULTISPECIES: hypothetical protein [Clostridium]MBD7913198.1 hypothetical protein [Clostridium cibarium]